MSIVGIFRRALPCMLVIAACSHTDPPAVEDPLVVPVPPARQQPSATVRDAGGACEPHDVPDFQPAWIPPKHFYQGLCTAEQILKLAECTAVGSTPSCKAFAADPANRICYGCALTGPTADHLGAMVDYRDWLIEPNYADCIANAEGDFTADGCGAMVEARHQCTLQACAACNADTKEDAVITEKCMDLAMDTVCKAWADKSVCEWDLFNGPAQMCGVQGLNDDQGTAYKWITLFCAVDPLADAGGDQ